MPASPSDRGGVWRLAPILFLGWTALLPGTALGQQLGPPIPLLPPPSASSPTLPPPSGSRRDDAVVSEPLAPPSAGWIIGTPVPDDALPEGLWRGTSRNIADLLLARLPDTTSPALQSLERRLLLSPAAVPQGWGAGDDRLQMLRAAALLRLGELDAARAVVAGIPESKRGPALPLAVAADAIGGNIEDACVAVRETVRHDEGAFWQTALIACQALQGQIEQARLRLQLLAEEQQEPQDKVLTAAVEKLAGQSSPPVTMDPADPLDPLTLRLLVAARWEIEPAFVGKLRPDLALCLALDDEAPAEARLNAAERAARYGALSPDRLRSLYTTLAVPGELNAGGALDHARQFAAIGRARNSAERMARIAGFIDALRSSEAAGLNLAARLVLPNLREMEPDSSLAGSAALTARLLLAAGDTGAAQRWSELVSTEQQGLLGLLFALTLPREEIVVDQADASPPVLFLGLASALGEPLPPTVWAGVPPDLWTVAGPASPPSAAWLDLTEAARGKRIGETVLAALIVASPGDTLSTDPMALFIAVSALRQVGLATDAHRLAVEAALAAGL